MEVCNRQHEYRAVPNADGRSHEGSAVSRARQAVARTSPLSRLEFEAGAPAWWPQRRHCGGEAQLAALGRPRRQR
jgi:hypothetical protein